SRFPAVAARRRARLPVYGSEKPGQHETPNRGSRLDASCDRNMALVALLCPDSETSSLCWSSAPSQPCGKGDSAACPADCSDGGATRRAHAVDPITAATIIAKTCRHVSDGIPMVLIPSTR